MLTLTENAAAVIRNIAGQQDMPEGTGMRIVAAVDGGLNLNMSPGPEEGDQVVDQGGARLFLDAQAAQMLDDKALDAAVDPDGAVQFALAEQDWNA
ncbi:adhesin [Jiangella asiatica]|uniref:Adhesin n=1 Tax=Jiangella asiatica TaxID=2530372 RepID=A0A4R5DCH6_9ACTN|nr:adhesin [Jiangella asiatica]TDE09521.1 adhesin [Jiangella asiatica]